MAARLDSNRSPLRYSSQFPRGHLIDSDARQVALNVYSYLRTTGKGISAAMTVTAEMTKISCKTLYKFKKEHDDALKLSRTKPTEGPPQQLVLMDTKNPDPPCNNKIGGHENIPLRVSNNSGKPKKPSKPPAGSLSPRSLGRRRKGTPNKPRSRQEKYGENTLTTIRMIVHDVYRTKETATAKDILKVVNEADDLPRFELRTFQRILHDLGFALTKPKKKKETVPVPVQQPNHQTCTISNNPRPHPTPQYQHEVWVNQTPTATNINW